MFSCDFVEILLNSGFYSQSESVGVSEIAKSCIFGILTTMLINVNE